MPTNKELKSKSKKNAVASVFGLLLIFMAGLFGFGMLSVMIPTASASSFIWVNPANTGPVDGLTKPTGYHTLWDGIAAMSPGDTLIIANGNWVGYPNMSVEHNHLPPSGIEGSGTQAVYTKVQAETDWEVRLPFIFSGSNSVDRRSYVEIRGIVFDSRANPNTHIVFDWHHTKFIRCGFLAGKLDGNIHNAGFGGTDPNRTLNHHNLMEESIAWGGGRYVFYNKFGQYNIYRGNLARHDYYQETAKLEHIANFRAYASDYTIYQNDISIDSDRVQYYQGSEDESSESSGFWIGDDYGAVGNEIHGSISIKDIHMSYYLAGHGTLGENTVIKNSVALDITVPGNTTLSAFVLSNGTGLSASNILGMRALGAGQDGFNNKGTSFTIKDSILKDVAEYGIVSVVANSYIDHYNADAVLWASWGTGEMTYDPQQNGLLYPVRIEAGSPLATAGSDGSRVGPEILYRIGRDADRDGISGLLYGEDGWDELQDGKGGRALQPLWPFPNEEKIKELMSETVEGISGIYGFTAYQSPFGSPNTLTSYIWEYLGNKIPPEIYGGVANQPPTVSIAASPTSGVSPLTVRFTATAQDSDGTIASYSWSFGDNSTATAQDPSHTYSAAGTYTARVEVTDNGGAKASASVEITVTAPPSPTQPPNIILQKSADKTEAAQGDIITYTITYENIGQGEARNIIITDPIPQGTTYITNSAAGSPVFDGATLTWTISTLSPSASGSVSFQARVE